jgi:dTDP-4-amino-4,6-dideoxygalactose transaminase
MLRNYGQRRKYYHDLKGHNRRLDTIQAAILRVKLARLDNWNAARRTHAALYHQLLANTPQVTLPHIADYSEPVWHLYVIRVERRDKLMTYLAEQGISCGIHYPVPVHMQQAYQDLGHKQGDFPFSEQYADTIVSLPMYAELTPTLVTRVAEGIIAFVGS